MVKKNRKEITEPVVEQETMGQADTTSTVPPGFVYVENLMAVELGITLTDGTHLSAGPKRGGNNKTRTIAKKFLPPYVRRMVQHKQIRIVEGGVK